MPKKKRSKIIEEVQNSDLFLDFCTEVTKKPTTKPVKPLKVTPNPVTNFYQPAKPLYQDDFVWSVSDFSSKLKGLIEDEFNFVSIKGEVSNYSKNLRSGNVFFDIKDEKSSVSVVCWKGLYDKLKFKIENGFEVVIGGRVSTFQKASKYHITLSKIRMSGEGEIMRIIKETHEKLRKEGLCDQDKKLPVPQFPKLIGVITSVSGSVIRDIIHRIKDRCPTRLMIMNCPMQGVSCSSHVSEAIEKFNNMGDLKPEVIIIARGGGSMEDLMPFNDEKLARTAFASQIPIISAIGHETDFTMLDYTSSLRAPTPTAAAEMCTTPIEIIHEDLEHTFRATKNLAKERLYRSHHSLKEARISVYKVISVHENMKHDVTSIKHSMAMNCTRILNRNSQSVRGLNNLQSIIRMLVSRNEDGLKSLILKMKSSLTTSVIRSEDCVRSYFDQMSHSLSLAVKGNKAYIEMLFKNSLSQAESFKGIAFIYNDNKRLESVKEIAELNSSGTKVLKIQMADGEVEVAITKVNKY